MTDEPRAPKGGQTLYKRYYRAGEWEPFYIPRNAMPQVDEADFPALLAFAKDQRVEYEFVQSLDPSGIHPHQRIDHDLARKIDPLVMAKPILLSIEPYILDGNHRWWEHNSLKLKIDAYRFKLQFEAALKFLFSFPRPTVLRRWPTQRRYGIDPRP